MADTAAGLDARVYFGKLAVLLVESNPLEREIVAQTLAGFKVRSLARCATVSDAMDKLHDEQPDLLVVGQIEGDAESFGFIRQVRRTKTDAIRMCPLILLSGHTLRRNVLQARDCGASLVIAKPLVPLVLFERILRLTRDQRAFITSKAYCGPDRRFQKLGPPPGTDGRRHDDLSLKVGEATAPNMSQAEIDAMLKPTRAQC